MGLSTSPTVASTVFFDYIGASNATGGNSFGDTAFGTFSIDDSLFDSTASQSISVSNLLSFSLTSNDFGSGHTRTWVLSELRLTSNIFFDSSGTPDVLGSSGIIAENGDPGGTLFLNGMGGIFDSVTVAFIDVSDGDWVYLTSAVPVPAAVWLFGTALIGLVGFGKRRKAA